MADVTSVRDTLNTSIETADATWDATMTTAGAAFGAAIDGIQDFDWQNVRDFVGTISNARKTAELGALSAQSSFLTSYYAGLNSYTSTLATASVGHSAAKAQATADYYINKADREADQAEADLADAIANSADSSTINSLAATATAARNKSNAFIAYGASYVGHLTSVAQTAATTATASVATSNATTLATITADIATATGEIHTFYTQQITDAANPPPVDDDADDDGVPDAPIPTATESIAAQLATIRTQRTTDRTTVREAFSGQITRRQLSDTNTLPATATTQWSGHGSESASEEQSLPEQYQATSQTQPLPPGTSTPNGVIQGPITLKEFQKKQQMADEIQEDPTSLQTSALDTAANRSALYYLMLDNEILRIDIRTLENSQSSGFQAEKIKKLQQLYESRELMIDEMRKAGVTPPSQEKIDQEVDRVLSEGPPKEQMTAATPVQLEIRRLMDLYEQTGNLYYLRDALGLQGRRAEANQIDSLLAWEAYQALEGLLGAGVAGVKIARASRVNPRTRLPRTRGKWVGTPGNGAWHSDLPQVNAVTGGKPVRFVNGRPMFTPWSRGQIKFKPGQLNGSEADFDAVYDYIAKQKGLSSRSAAKNYLRDAGLTPHHLDGTTIQLIPSDLHGNIPDIGSASDLRGF